MRASSIVLSQHDFEQITRLVERVSATNFATIDALEEELARATIVAEEALPRNIVAMYSVVEYEDLATGKINRVQVTFPEDADISTGKISVLAPVGAALIGLKIGQTIDWPLPGGRKTTLCIRNIELPEQDAEKDRVLLRHAS